MNTPPICIVTRNRHKFLDITLRSLSATVPPEQQLVVFDDASDDPETLRYLYSADWVDLTLQFPVNDFWQRTGLTAVRSRERGQGVAGRVEVIKLAESRLGVVGASCRALCLMTEKYGEKHGINICQDDVIFNKNWLPRMAKALQAIHDRDAGLVCGCWINSKFPASKRALALIPSKGVTAQCYYVTPAGLVAMHDWLRQDHSERTGFDGRFCGTMRAAGKHVYKIFPAVCQHIGYKSNVRPHWKWTRRGSKGRIDYSAKGPYPLAIEVNAFEEKT